MSLSADSFQTFSRSTESLFAGTFKIGAPDTKFDVYTGVSGALVIPHSAITNYSVLLDQTPTTFQTGDQADGIEAWAKEATQIHVRGEFIRYVKSAFVQAIEADLNDARSPRSTLDLGAPAGLQTSEPKRRAVTRAFKQAMGYPEAELNPRSLLHFDEARISRFVCSIYRHRRMLPTADVMRWMEEQCQEYLRELHTAFHHAVST